MGGPERSGGPQALDRDALAEGKYGHVAHERVLVRSIL